MNLSRTRHILEFYCKGRITVVLNQRMGEIEKLLERQEQMEEFKYLGDIFSMNKAEAYERVNEKR